jgi:phospholipid/cholesterol/gamma-HCH transport system substrate-binding protein
MDLTYKQEVGVGALVIIGLGLFALGLLWFSGRSIGSHGIYVDAVFVNVQGLKEGDPVLVSGVKKGRVAKVRLDRVGKVTVTLQLSSDVRPKMDAGATITSSDLFGAKLVDYFPGAKDEPLPAGRVIIGSEQPQLADIAAGVATRANELIGHASGLVNEQLGVDIHNTMVATQRAMNTVTQMGGGTVGNQATKTLSSIERVMSRIDTLLGSANPVATGKRIDTLSTNLTKLTDQLSQATGTLSDLLNKLSHSGGTLGKLASDTTLYTDLHQTLTALTALLNDLKERPGRYLQVKVF